ncbi:hypothetical protein FPZ43_11100 [Mucilaginibacter pallidiroseus]|uniref:Long-chain fatty acid transport protein n=1 Tax=Mucilaginibacter pallidiroseus TaxID=2599295 RepID=A0A563UBR7_9SPHI|nr:hypothetical protein [Mucilaginibacter pallidiroseus]TWR28811.1 hypothetical protein FPZ43_11100 [Mucilaginibacter pallidiroseus]
MKIKYILSVVAIVALTKNSFAQYSQDAIRFSGGLNGSTSRIKALGNAGTAVGGDLSNISGNPAGLGFFTRSELSITPEFDGSKVKSTYFGQSMSDSRNSGNVAHAGLVIYNQLSKPRGADKSKGWLSVNYGVSFSRNNNFYENISYGGVNNTSTIANYYSNLANQTKLSDNQGFYLPDGSLQSWAYNQYLIEEQNGNYFPNAQNGSTQLMGITREGGVSTVDFSLGANYSNKLYLGFGVGFTSLRYNSSQVFSENGVVNLPATPTDPAESLNYQSQFYQNQITRGSGINARLGLIYKPVESVRLGATFTSPTWYNIDDNYSEGLSTRYPQSTSNANFSDGTTDPYFLNYNLRTPWKVAGGLAVFAGKYGFITGDVEYVDYSSAKILRNNDYNNTGDNADIASLYRGAINARIGAEARLNSIFSLRGGYGIQGRALRDKDLGGDIKTASAGIGARFGAYYVDATYLHITNNQTVFPYEVGAASPSALLNRSANNGYLTIGYRF